MVAVKQKTKICSKCKQEKPLDEFYHDNNKTNGKLSQRHSSCKICQGAHYQAKVTSQVKRRIEGELKEIPYRVILMMIREDKELLRGVLRMINARRFKQLAQQEREKIFDLAEERIRKWSRDDQVRHIEGGREQLVERRIAALRQWKKELW